MSALWGLVSILTTTFVAPFVGAAEPVALPLPTEVDYAEQMVSQVSGTTFSTDPTAEQVGQVLQAVGGPQLQVFIINKEACVQAGDATSYRVFIRNIGNQRADDVVGQFTYPAGQLDYRGANPSPKEIPDPEQGLIEWDLGSIAANGGTRTLNISFTITGGGVLQVDFRAFNAELAVGTSHTIDGDCSPPPTFDGRALPANKQAAIICDPAEVGCVGFLPGLGFNFRRAQNVAQQPQICSPNDPRGCVPNLPDLGPRFAEAYPVIEPGECRVVEDDIVITPEFHDGFWRKAEPAAAYLTPLWRSGRDFVRLGHENELLNIDHFVLEVREALLEQHDRNWDKHIRTIERVLEESLTPAQAVATYNAQTIDWKTAVKNLHGGFKDSYEDIQDQKKEKFDPVAEQAVTNARQSIQLACGVAGDGGLAGLLGVVKAKYEAGLAARTAAYPRMQTASLTAYGARLATYSPRLQAAIRQFEAGNEKLLEGYLAEVTNERSEVFKILLEPYRDHSSQDRTTDEQVRKGAGNSWEGALDAPKRVATNCEKELRFAPPIEVTWCESGNAPEFIIREAPDPIKGSVNPPVVIPGGAGVINPQLSVGVSCGGRPGDPMWASDCSCNCGQLIPNLRDGNILFCQRTFEVPRRIGDEELPIVRHDVYQDFAECVFETPRHTNPNPFDLAPL